MPRFLFFLLCLFAGFSVSAQKVHPDSIKSEMITDKNLVLVKYKISNINKNKQYLAVSVTAVGKQEGLIPITTATGDIGVGVDPDESREMQFTFDPVQYKIEDLKRIDFDIDVVSLPFKYAEHGKELTAPRKQIPSLVTTGLGAGVGVVSYLIYQDSKNLYDTYTSELNPFASIYSEMSRPDHLDNANKKYLTAQVLAAGSAALLATGIVSWIKYKTRKADWKKMQRLSLASGTIGDFQYAAASTPWGMTLTVNLQRNK